MGFFDDAKDDMQKRAVDVQEQGHELSKDAKQRLEDMREDQKEQTDTE